MKDLFFTYFLTLIILISFFSSSNAQKKPSGFADPPKEFSVMPFWFWNDTLKDAEIIRQIADFEAHGVYGFVIHPRIGLPESIGWLSPQMIHFMHVAIEEASRRNMYVILYDEGMYPSGSSSGQVVARNPEHAARGLAKIDLKAGQEPELAKGMKLVTVIDRPGGGRMAVVEQPSGGVIRGIHYIGERTDYMREDLPLAGDILNPEAADSFIELVYETYASEFDNYFGTTIMGIFTDEPSPLGRDHTRGIVPGNASLLPQINKILGYDITPFLAALWYEDTPDSKSHKADYYRAVNMCLEENYYKRLGDWCSRHGIALMGHPGGSMDIGTLRYFQMPGQDLVWRYVEPGTKALEGQHSTMAKCASSAMIHLGTRRNSNEIYGAYGHNLTYEEMEWLANWCFVRGHNFLIPHAFYYSVRGPRLDERPPDVGPNASWWNSYKPYADACRRLSWLNTDSRHVCELAILAEATYLSDKAAKVCYQNQRDFNYLEIRHLWEDAKVDSKGIHIAGMHYKALIIDSLSHMPPEAKPLLQKLARNGRLIFWKDSQFPELFTGSRIAETPEELMMSVNKLSDPDILLAPSSENMRVRHVIKENDHYYMLFNEEASEIRMSFNFQAKGRIEWLDPHTGQGSPHSPGDTVPFRPYEFKLLKISTDK
ncbi:MAG: glycosyl hydrolase [Mariniphaga sp.]